MALVWLLLDAETFQEQIHPALSACWRQRSFHPCQALCTSLASAVRSFGERYFTSVEESLLNQIPKGVRFDRSIWRLLVSEVLIYSAADIPEIPSAADALCCLLAPDRYQEGQVPRERYVPIQQAHFGSRDLIFGSGYYRPDQAGWNDRDDVGRLASYLGNVDPDSWAVADLASLQGITDEEERAEELADAREWFPALRELYERARNCGHVVICEIM